MASHNARVSDDEFIQLFRLHGPSKMARQLDMNASDVHKRRKRLEKRLQVRIVGPNQSQSPTIQYDPRVNLDVQDGCVIVFSDAHYWPGPTTTAHRALLKMCAELKPKAVICNGDAFDGATASRFSPGMWEELPTLADELEACQERLSEIIDASPKAKHIWTLGNHDARFESQLANKASEFKGINGMHLKDHFPDWKNGFAVWINDDVVIKHRWKGGIHATHNNAVQSGKSMVTGHLHSLKITPYSDYNGTRFGVDTGTLADPYSPQFAYGEDNPVNHRSGFAVLNFHKGELLWPELVSVMEPGKVQFRGQVLEV